MNPLYQMIIGNQNSQPAQQQMGPLQRMNCIQQAMANPAAFVKQRFPDIPDEIMNNPVQILQYLQQTRGIQDQQIQNLYRMYGGRK